MTVKEVMAGITPSADYAGLEMADDFVLAFQTADTQQDVNDYIVCQECITEHSAAVNPGTQDKQYIRKGNAPSRPAHSAPSPSPATAPTATPGRIGSPAWP